MHGSRKNGGATDYYPEGVADLGAALEMLHTYSLIHDDLPALDNDDLRRGQPTCHVLFGEATAILAGDALQTLAFQTIAALPTPPATTVAILREVSLAVGTGVGRVGDLDTKLPPGMIGGQVVDIEVRRPTPYQPKLVKTIPRAKTGALNAIQHRLRRNSPGDPPDASHPPPPSSSRSTAPQTGARNLTSLHRHR